MVVVSESGSEGEGEDGLQVALMNSMEERRTEGNER